MNGKRQLFLHNLLRVPKIKKNLISVSQFANDNNVYFEFYPKYCLVRDMLTKNILLQGNSENGLYKFNSRNYDNYEKGQQHCNFSEKENHINMFDLWHYKLGHPSIKVVRQILAENKISANNIAYHIYVPIVK